MRTVCIKIPVNDIFAEVLDQTLYDSRAITGVVNDITAMAQSDKDIFEANLRTVAVELYLYAKQFGITPDAVTYSIEVRDGISPDVVASRVKDIIKYGMLEWWFSTRNGDLAAVYHEKRKKRLGALIGAQVTSRGFSYY